MTRLDLPMDIIIEKYELGIGSVILGKEYNCSAATILSYLGKYGIKVRNSRQVRKDLPIDIIAKKYESGISILELSKKYNCNAITIINHLHKYGIKIRNSGPVKKNLPIDIIIEKYESGIGSSKLAKEYDCDLGTIINRLREKGIKIRRASEDPNFSKKISAGHQGISYDEWESFASEQKYCPLFNESCRESNREKYDRKCFLSGLPESENMTKTGKLQKLSVHHVDMDKNQGCNGIKWKLVPLCMSYHGMAHKESWKSRIIYLLENVW